jgi:hypothetical protein
VLAESDNDAAETLLWQAALEPVAGPATPESDVSAADVLATELQRLGLWDDGMVVLDGNGISADNQVTPDALVGRRPHGPGRPRPAPPPHRRACPSRASPAPSTSGSTPPTPLGSWAGPGQDGHHPRA